MALVEWRGEISPSMRRWFGLSCGAFVLAIATIFRNSHALVLPVGIGVACTVGGVYYLARSWQVTLIRGWQTLTFPLAWVVGHTLLLTVFVAVVTPIGLVLTCFGYDPLHLHTKPSSMWRQRQPRDTSSYFKQH